MRSEPGVLLKYGKLDHFYNPPQVSTVIVDSLAYNKMIPGKECKISRPALYSASIPLLLIPHQVKLLSA